VSRNNTLKKSMASEYNCIKITAIWGMGGHEEHYVLRCWDLTKPECSQFMPCPTEIAQELEDLMKSSSSGSGKTKTRWSLCHRGNRVEIHLMQGSMPCKFTFDHKTLRELIVKACSKVSYKLEEIRCRKPTEDYADMNTDAYFKRCGLYFPALELEVGEE